MFKLIRSSAKVRKLPHKVAVQWKDLLEELYSRWVNSAKKAAEPSPGRVLKLKHYICLPLTIYRKRVLANLRIIIGRENQWNTQTLAHWGRAQEFMSQTSPTLHLGELWHWFLALRQSVRILWGYLLCQEDGCHKYVASPFWGVFFIPMYL